MPTEFLCTTNLTGETHSTGPSWESDTQADLTAVATKVFNHGGKTGVLMANGDTVTGQTSGATATVSFCTDPVSHSSISQGQLMLKVISGTFQNGEVVERDADNADVVTLSDAGDSVITVLDSRKTDGEIAGQEMVFSGTTTSATNYRMLTGRENKGDGKNYNSTGTQWSATTSATILMDVLEDNVVMEWLMLRSNQGGAITEMVDGGSGSGNSLTLRNCILKGGDGASNSNVMVRPGTSDSFVWNCILYGNATYGIRLQGGEGLIVNTLVYGSGINNGYTRSGAGANNGIIKNCIAMDCNNDNWQSGGFDNTNSKNNMGKTGDTDMPGSGDQTSSAGVEFVSVTGGSEDFHIKDESAVAVDNGVDTSGDGVTISLDNITRPQGAGFDIGPHELAMADGKKAFNEHFNSGFNRGFN